MRKLFLCTLILFSIIISQVHAQVVLSPTRDLPPIQEYIKNKGIKRLYEVARCESSFKIDAVGDHGLAYGVMQFHKATFDGYAKKYGLLLDYKNPYHQVDLATLMFKDKLQYHWTCK